MADNPPKSKILTRWEVILGILTFLVSLATPLAIWYTFNDPAKAPALNVSTSMEQIGESDSCYIIKAKIDIENTSKSRVNVAGNLVQLIGYYATIDKSVDTGYDAYLRSSLLNHANGFSISQHLGLSSDQHLACFTILSGGAWFNPLESYHTERIAAVPKGIHLVQLYVNFALGLEIKNMVDTYYVRDGFACVGFKDTKGKLVEDKKVMFQHNIAYQSSLVELWLKQPQGLGFPNCKAVN